VLCCAVLCFHDVEGFNNNINFMNNLYALKN